MHPVALLLSDARLPVAGHTQSGGLEPALAAGLDDVPGYLALRLATVTRTEAATAVVTLAHLQRGEGIDAVYDAWAARTPSAAMRETSRELGRALWRLASRLWPLPPLPAWMPRPVVLGAVAVACDLPAEDLVRVIGYDDLQTVASAALKLRPLDPAVATGWVVAALPLLDQLASSVTGLARPEEIPATGAPWIEQLAETHAATSRRLFRA
ncbi:urease accessory protein UreF [Nocardioides gansuensis]|uniref:Urease accessory protein UreF n=1 Tax=Nocardioides gansuensis TaxID=2138300 RepID=A0A2T8FFG2_9ACTN|nr:urease accessory UreF family protein [Nocardioides gansuensis]PVG84458.1 urease accessory protein UreF [Nocardioides gansuensis]